MIFSNLDEIEPPSPPRPVYELPNADTDTESEAEYQEEEMDQVDDAQFPREGDESDDDVVQI